MLLVAGCHKQARTSDPELEDIQQMLDSQLPAGSTAAKVNMFLDTQGYRSEPAQKPETIVAVIRKIDTKRLKPATARVTFYFDANGKLTEFALQRIPNQPIL